MAPHSSNMMKQPAFAQPTHRRPAWAKTEAMYNANISRSSSRSYGPRSDHGLDNFSYDEAHAAEFELPEDLVHVLPHELRRAASTWILAAAALNTAFDRIRKLDQDPIDQLEPAATSSKSTSFTTWLTSASSPPIGPADSDITIHTPATSPPQSFDASIIAPIAKYGCSYPHIPPNMLGMDTPPFTPVDTRGPNTPTNSARALHNTMPDPLSLDVHLAPLSVPDPLSPLDSTDRDAEMTWERYAKTYNAEVYDLKRVSFPRFAGLDRTVCKLLVEMEMEDGTSPERRSAVDRFRRWWKGHRGRVTQYQAMVDAVQEKLLPEC